MAVVIRRDGPERFPHLDVELADCVAKRSSFVRLRYLKVAFRESRLSYLSIFSDDAGEIPGAEVRHPYARV